MKSTLGRHAGRLLGLALLCLLALQLFFVARIALMTVVDPAVDDLPAQRGLAPADRERTHRVEPALGR